MADVHVVSSPTTMRWNFFLTACIFVGGLMLKVGAPVEAVVFGMVLAALWNWKGPRIQPPWGGRSGK